MKEIKNKIIKSEDVEWIKLKFIQDKTLKSISKEVKEKLKQSIINNEFLESFKVWENGKDLYCLDGMHRYNALNELMKEGYTIPKLLRADFLYCSGYLNASFYYSIYFSGIDGYLL